MQNNLKKYHETPELHFSICSNNKELFSKFELEMRKQGYLGFPDLRGNMHYIVDARKGFPSVYKKINHITMNVMEEKINYHTERYNRIEAIADYLLHKYQFDHSLIGTKFLFDILLLMIDDESLLLSLSNDLYPLIAEKYQSSTEKICYSLRYVFRKLELKEQEQRKKGLKRMYFYDENSHSSSNRVSLNKLLKEAQELLLAGHAAQDFGDASKNKLKN